MSKLAASGRQHGWEGVVRHAVEASAASGGPGVALFGMRRIWQLYLEMSRAEFVVEIAADGALDAGEAASARLGCERAPHPPGFSRSAQNQAHSLI